MVRRSSSNDTTAQVRIHGPHSRPSGSLIISPLCDRTKQKRRALAIDLLIGLGLPILNMILCVLTLSTQISRLVLI